MNPHDGRRVTDAAELLPVFHGMESPTRELSLNR